MKGGRLSKYQAMLLDTAEIMLKTCPTLNPASLIPGPDRHTSMLGHECSEMTVLVYSHRPDLKDPQMTVMR